VKQQLKSLRSALSLEIQDVNVANGLKVQLLNTVDHIVSGL